MPNSLILIIDDKLANQEAIRQQLEQSDRNFTCTFLSDLTVVANLLSRQNFDAVLLNINAIDEDCSTFLRTLNQAFIPVIGLALPGQENAILSLLAEGMSNYVVQDSDRHYLKLLPITLANAIEFAQAKKQLAAADSSNGGETQQSIYPHNHELCQCDRQPKRNWQKFWLEGQQRILELMTLDAPLSDVLELLVTTVEQQSCGLLGSVLLLKGQRLWTGAAPSLPNAYLQSISGGIEIGPQSGSCGTAAHRREPVMVSDIAIDPLWDGIRELVLPYGLRSCWSTPIFAQSGAVLGTFAFYHQDIYVPNQQDWKLVDVATSLAALAIEHKQTVHSLGISKERFRITFEQAAIGICHASTDGRLLHFNQRFCAMTGYSSEELQSLTFQEITHPDDLPTNLQYLQRLLRGNLTTYTLEKRYIRKDRTIIWINLTVSLAQDLDNDTPYLIGIAEDITNRKQAEALLQSLVEGAAAVTGHNFFPVLAEYIATALDVRYVIISRRQDDRFVACAFWDGGQLRPSMTLPLEHTPLSRSIANGVYYCPSQLKQTFPESPLLSSLDADTYLGIRLTNIEGEVIGALCILDHKPLANYQRAIAILQVFAMRAGAELQRQEAIEALQTLNQELEQRVDERTAELQYINSQLQQAIAERQKFVSLIENSTDFIAIATATGHMTYLNPAGRELVGLEKTADITNYLIEDFHPAEDWADLQQTVLRSLSQEESWQGEVRLQHLQTGEYIPAMHSAFPIRHPQTGAVLSYSGILRDITERKQIEQQLRDLSSRLSLAVESASIGIWDWDIVNNRIFWDDRMYELYGVRQEDFGNAYEAWLHAVHPDDRARADDMSLQARQGLRDYSCEFRVLHADGSIRYIQANALVQRNAAGEACRMIGINFDVTDRKEIEMRLRASEATLLEAQRVAHIGNWSFDVQTQTIHWSEELYRMFGLEPSQLAPTYSEYLRTIHPADRQQVIDCLDEAIATGKPYCIDYRVILDNGSIRYQEGRGEAIRDSQGQVIQLFGTAIDISDRKQAELELRRSRELRDAIFNKSTDALFLVDAKDALIFDCNERAVELFEAERKEDLLHISGNTLQRRPFSREELSDIIAEVRRTGFWSRELEYVSKKGRIFWANIACTTVIVAGEPIQLVRLTDITDRKTIEFLLQQQLEKEQLLVSILKRIRDSLNLNDILNVTVEEVRQTINANRILVYQLNEDGSGQVVAESITDPWKPLLNRSFPAETLPADCFDRYLQGGIYRIEDCEKVNMAECARQFMIDLQIRAKLVVPIVQQENKRVWGLLIAHECARPRHWEPWEIALLQQLAGQLAIAIQQADLYQQLQLTNMELARATRLKDEFLANMSHELRTPLNAILGMAEALQEFVLGDLNTQQKKAISTIEHSGRHLLDLINDILDLAKIEAGKLELNLELHGVKHLCSSSLSLVKQMAHSKNIRLSAQIAPDLRDIDVDDRRIRQVLINLLSNAVKFTPNGGSVTLKAWSETDLWMQRWIHFAVEDTGIGIAAEDMPKLFQSFVQIDSKLNRQFNGTGLGLSLVKRIVELHGGRVEVTSTVNQGSTFSVVIPYHSIGAEVDRDLSSSHMIQTLQTLPAVDEDGSAAVEPLILLAEDNQANVETFTNYLIHSGYRIMVAANGAEAVALAIEHHPQLILMDIQMPEVDGLEAIQRLRSLPELSQIPIIALTALAMPGDRDQCLAAGANDYLAKPVRLRYLAQKIAELLANGSISST